MNDLLGRVYIFKEYVLLFFFLIKFVNYRGFVMLVFWLKGKVILILKLNVLK